MLQTKPNKNNSNSVTTTRGGYILSFLLFKPKKEKKKEKDLGMETPGRIQNESHTQCSPIYSTRHDLN